MAEPVGVVKQIEQKIAASVDKVEAASAPSTPPTPSSDNGEVTLLDRLLNFVSECWRMFWPLVITLIILWYFETIRLSYMKAKAVEPTWLGTIKTVHRGMIGLLLAHLTRSGAFPYVKLRVLYRDNPEVFSRVFLAVMLYYIGWIVGAMLAP